MKRVLFVCTGNAGRSQMAEALFRTRVADRIEILSAGVDPWDDLHPMARHLMAERGLDLAGHHPKHVADFADADIAAVITIGDRADNESPAFRTGVRRIHWDIGDPADADGTPDSESVFRSACRRIEERLPGIEILLDSLPEREEASWAPALSTTVFRSTPFTPTTHIPLLVKAGFRHIELCGYSDTVDFPWENARSIAELKQVAGDCGVTVVSIHPPDRANPAAELENDRDRQMDVLRRSLDLAEDLGAGSLSIHVGLGLPVGTERESALKRLDESLDRLAAWAAPSPAMLCLETLPERPSDLTNAEVLDRVLGHSASACGMVLDSGHAHIAGVLDGLPERIGRRLQNLHLHDNDGTADQHAIPGKGTTEWPAFMRSLRTSGYEGPLLLEVEARETPDIERRLADCMQAVQRLRALGKEAA